jgi:hypothetical protein
MVEPLHTTILGFFYYTVHVRTAFGRTLDLLVIFFFNVSVSIVLRVHFIFFVIQFVFPIHIL